MDLAEVELARLTSVCVILAFKLYYDGRPMPTFGLLVKSFIIIKRLK